MWEEIQDMEAEIFDIDYDALERDHDEMLIQQLNEDDRDREERLVRHQLWLEEQEMREQYEYDMMMEQLGEIRYNLEYDSGVPFEVNDAYEMDGYLDCMEQQERWVVEQEYQYLTDIHQSYLAYGESL